MSREILPFIVSDVSGLAKALRKSLLEREGVPSHVEMLHLLAKAAGHRNFQHFRAAVAPAAPRPAPKAVAISHKRVARVARLFDEAGVLARWPGKYLERVLCLWALWRRIPARTDFTEREISDLLAELHRFGDHALLRRELVDHRLLERTSDGARYRRIEAAPPAEALAVFARLKD